MWGTGDVVLACVLAAMVFAVMVAAHGKISRQAEDATYRAYRILTHGIFVMLVVFFLAGERIIWRRRGNPRVLIWLSLPKMHRLWCGMTRSSTTYLLTYSATFQSR